MKKLTIQIDHANYLEDGLKNYLQSLNGTSQVTINKFDNKIDITYNPTIVNLKLIKLEILLYLNLQNLPSIISFDKHSKKKVSKRMITIENLCCEYCLKNRIEELLETEGIESAYFDFDYHKKDFVNILITYDNELIGDSEVEELIKKIEEKPGIKEL